MSHSHGSGGCCHGGAGGASLGRPVDDASAGIEFSLYQKINLDEVECLNEAEENSGRSVFKAWEDRKDKEKVTKELIRLKKSSNMTSYSQFVISDADEELLFNIPFSGNVKLKGIIVIGAEDGQHPGKMRLFKNRPHLTFDEVRGKPDQEFELVRDDSGAVEYPTKVVTFSSVSHLSIHFPSNLGGEDETKVLLSLQ